MQAKLTILTILDALQVSKLGFVQQAEWLPRGGNHCGHRDRYVGIEVARA